MGGRDPASKCPSAEQIRQRVPLVEDVIATGAGEDQIGIHPSASSAVRNHISLIGRTMGPSHIHMSSATSSTDSTLGSKSKCEKGWL